MGSALTHSDSLVMSTISQHIGLLSKIPILSLASVLKCHRAYSELVSSSPLLFSTAILPSASLTWSEQAIPQETQCAVCPCTYLPSLGLKYPVGTMGFCYPQRMSSHQERTG